MTVLLVTSSMFAGSAPQDPLQGMTVVSPLGHELAFSIYSSVVDGLPRSAIVKGDALTSSPAWSPDDDVSPPISIKRAVELARQALKGAVRDSSLWGLATVRLDHVNRYWLYIVTWQPTGGGKDYLQVPVLLSGTVVPLEPLADVDDQ